MKPWLVLLALSASLTVFSPTAEAAGADRLFTKSCPKPLERRLQQAKQFLIRYQHRLADDFEIDSRNVKENKVHRQILRRVEKIGFKCKLDDGCDTHTALQSIVGGNQIRICARNLESAPFHRVVAVVAHEFGHNAHIPRARGGAHNRRGPNDPDKVYQFGYFAQELARETYGMGFPVGGRKDPVTNAGLAPPYGIELYPRKNRQGHPVKYTANINAYGSANMERHRYRHGTMNDLRFIGRHDAISSIVIKSGRWEICTQKDYKGKCRVISSSVDNLKSLKMNNKISSLRYVGG